MSSLTKYVCKPKLSCKQRDYSGNLMKNSKTIFEALKMRTFSIWTEIAEMSVQNFLLCFITIFHTKKNKKKSLLKLRIYPREKRHLSLSIRCRVFTRPNLLNNWTKHVIKKTLKFETLVRWSLCLRLTHMLCPYVKCSI